MKSIPIKQMLYQSTSKGKDRKPPSTSSSKTKIASKTSSSGGRLKHIPILPNGYMPHTSKSNSKLKTNTQRSSPSHYNTNYNEQLLKMSKYKRYQPPIRKTNKPRLNSSSNNSSVIKKINNTAIGNECIVNKKYFTFFPDKIDAKLGLNEEIFNDDNIMLTDMNLEKELQLNPFLKDEKLSYEEWNKVKKDKKSVPIRKINLKKKFNVKSSTSTSLNKSRNSYNNRIPIKVDRNSKASSSGIFRSEERHNTLNTSKREQKQIIKNIKDKISNNNTTISSINSTLTNNNILITDESNMRTLTQTPKEKTTVKCSVLQSLKGLFGDNFENFDETLLFSQLEPKRLKEVVKELAITAFSQEKAINSLAKENEFLNQELIKKDVQIEDLSSQLNGLRSNLLGLIQTSENKGNYASPVPKSINNVYGNVSSFK